MDKCLAICVFGRVQHVGFRHFAVKEAVKYHICGFVRNENDGSVYIEACAKEKDLDLYISAINKGPAWGRVDKLSITLLPQRSFKGFKVQY